MSESARSKAAAEFLWRAHQVRAPYCNLPDPIRPANEAEAYAAQTAFHALAAPSRGAVAGLKIATTTKVMQELMGIDHPCGGAIFANTIHRCPARLHCGNFVNLRIECEIAVRLGDDLPIDKGPYTADSVRPAVATVMPAFELIEDRNAVYKETDAYSMIADNCWNAGIVLGPESSMRPELDLDALRGRLEINGRLASEGTADRPLWSLAWLANRAARSGHGISRGMIVITGSLVATTSVAPGDHAVFTIGGLGETRLELT